MRRLLVQKRTLAVAAALAVGAGLVAGREKSAPPSAVQARAPQAHTAAAPSELEALRLARAEFVAPRNDPFAPRSFAPPAPAPTVAKAAPPEPPSAPPLPFAYFGSLTQDGKTEVYVIRDDEVISIAAGRKIDAEYRVEAVSASSIRFVYLPLKTVQSLELTEAGG